MTAQTKAAAAAVSATPAPLLNRFDLVMLFDCAMGNPNGDPDAANQPRTDPYDNTGFITGACLRRKIRDYMATVHGVTLYHANGVVLREQRATALRAAGIEPSASAEELAAQTEAPAAEDGAKKGKRGAARPKRESVTMEDLRRNQRVLCDAYWDMRTFGGVTDTGGARALNATGPVLVEPALSIHPVRLIEASITRQSVENPDDLEKERAMGNVMMLRYGLYRTHIKVNPFFAERTGFSKVDMDHLLDALMNAFELDQSANRRLNLRGLYVFEHESPDGRPCLGRAPGASLTDRVQVTLNKGVEDPTRFADYTVSVDEANLPEGVVYRRLV